MKNCIKNNKEYEKQLDVFFQCVKIILYIAVIIVNHPLYIVKLFNYGNNAHERRKNQKQKGMIADDYQSAETRWT